MICWLPWDERREGGGKREEEDGREILGVKERRGEGRGGARGTGGGNRVESMGVRGRGGRRRGVVG